MRLIRPHYKEGYNTLISEEEVCISRVEYILAIKTNGWNVAYCRVTDCRRELRTFLVFDCLVLQIR